MKQITAKTEKGIFLCSEHISDCEEDTVFKMRQFIGGKNCLNLPFIGFQSDYIGMYGYTTLPETQIKVIFEIKETM